MADSDGRLWAWVEMGSDGRPSIVAASIPGVGTVAPLIMHDREIIEALRPIAQARAKASGKKVWLREYALVANHDDA